MKKQLILVPFLIILLGSSHVNSQQKFSFSKEVEQELKNYLPTLPDQLQASRNFTRNTNLDFTFDGIMTCDYLKVNLDKRQTDYIKGEAVHINVRRKYSRITSARKAEGSDVLLRDNPAYNLLDNGAIHHMEPFIGMFINGRNLGTIIQHIHTLQEKYGTRSTFKEKHGSLLKLAEGYTREKEPEKRYRNRGVEGSVRKIKITEPYYFNLSFIKELERLGLPTPEGKLSCTFVMAYPYVEQGADFTGEEPFYIYESETFDLNNYISGISRLVSFEINPETGAPYKGIVADGVSKLKIKIQPSPDEQLEELRFKQPELGSVSGKNLEKLTDNVYRVPTSKKPVTLTYTPPTYLESNALNKSQRPADKRIWYNEIPIKFRKYLKDGQEKEKHFMLQLYRPPIMLVHGFTGKKTTWARLDNYLTSRKYNTYRGEYYALDESIPAQSRLLKRHIKEKKNEYLTNDIKIGKVDIIAHSMGGLISRFYIEEAPYYDKDVRKLIMVGTPNHGVSPEKLLVGFIASKQGVNKHEIAAQQLFQYSDFMMNLNLREDEGEHINVNVQYGNIYSYTPRLMAGDMVVAASSAYLDGIENRQFEGYIHSTEIPGLASAYPSITDAEAIYKQILTWLGRDLEKKQLKTTKIRIINIEDELEVWDLTRGSGQSNKGRKITLTQNDIPYLMKPGQYVRTKTGRAIIDVAIDAELFGRMMLAKNSSIQPLYFSPSLIEVRMQKGSARFRTYPDEYGLGHFTIDMDSESLENQRFTGIGTDFSVKTGEKNVEMYCYEGKVVGTVDVLSKIHNVKIAKKNTGLRIAPGYKAISIGKPGINSWNDEFFKVEKTSYKKDGQKGSGESGDGGNVLLYVIIAILVLLFIIGRTKKAREKKRAGEKNKKEKKVKKDKRKDKAKARNKKQPTNETKTSFSETASVRSEEPTPPADFTSGATCTSCGKTIPEDTEICPYCGAGVETESEPRQNFCPNCGSKVNEDDNFCGSCGHKLK